MPLKNKSKVVSILKDGKEQTLHLITVSHHNEISNKTGYVLYTTASLEAWDKETASPFINAIFFKTKKEAFAIGEIILKEVSKPRRPQLPKSKSSYKAKVVNFPVKDNKFLEQLSDEYLDAKILESLEKSISKKVKPHNRKLIKSMMLPQCGNLNQSFLMLVKSFSKMDKKSLYKLDFLTFVYESFIKEYEVVIRHYINSGNLAYLIASAWFHILSELKKDLKEKKNVDAVEFLEQLQQDINSSFTRIVRGRKKVREKVRKKIYRV